MMNPAMRVTAGEQRVVRAWEVLQNVLDPEVPALSVCDLGIVRDVFADGDGIEVVLTPTYSGCPATEVIEQSVIDAVNEGKERASSRQMEGATGTETPAGEAIDA